MRILYVSSLCTPTTYGRLLPNESQRIGQQVQKFGALLVEGLRTNGAEITVLSKPPVNRRNNNRTFIRTNAEQLNGVGYRYQVVVNLPVVGHIITFLSAFLSVLRFCARDATAAVLCNPLTVITFLAALSATRITRNPLVAVVTDIPTVYAGSVTAPVSFPMALSGRLSNRADSYVLLTEAMTTIVNPRKRPFVVMEGLVDLRAAAIENTLQKKHQRRICLYAGGIRAVYGLEDLVHAFVLAGVVDTELHIYGGGTFEEDLATTCATYPNVEFLGVRDNAFIVHEQARATLLVNPRPSGPAYTRYSFPSKTLEYLASGTPVLTTKLPGIPAEYFEHVYIFDDESVEGMARRLREVLSLPRADLHRRGLEARDWALTTRDNVSQTRRILDLIEESFRRRR